MEDIKRGVLSGLKIDEEKAEVLANVADKIRELDNGKLDPEEIALGDMMGAGSSVNDEIKEGTVFKAGDGSKVADHSVLSGMEIPADKAEVIGKVADTIEEVEAYEADGTKKSSGIDKISDTLAVTMGVKHE